MEPAASRSTGADASHRSGAHRRPRPHRGRQRLHESGGRPVVSMAAGPHGNAGDRWFRAQRKPRTSAPAFRGQRRIHRRRRALAIGSRWPIRCREGCRGVRRTGPRHGKVRPRAGLMHTGQRVAVLGMAVSGALALAKITAGLAGNSTAVVADGCESAGDVFASGFVLLGLTLAAKPADREHPYGHGRIETLTGLLIGLVLTAAGVLISVASFEHLGQPRLPLATFVVWPL